MRARIEFGLALFIAVAFDLSYAAAPNAEEEPTYHGKKVQEWAKCLKNKDAKLRRRAAVYLGQAPFGKAGVPALRDALGDDDSEVVKAAVHSLGLLGRNAEKSIPELESLLYKVDRATQIEIIETLGRIGPPALPLLMVLLESGSNDLKTATVRALCQVGPDAKEAVNLLVGVAKTEKDLEFSDTVQALAAIGEPAVLKLIEGAKDVQGKDLACHAFGSMRPIPKKAIAFLLEKVKDSEEIASRSAIWALRNSPEFPPEAIPKLIESIKSRDSKFRHRTIQMPNESLVRMGLKAVPALENELKNPDGDVARIAFRALQQIKPRTFSELTETLKDRNLRFEAITALRNHVGDLSSVMPVLIEAFNHGSPQIQSSLVWAVQDFGHQNEVIQFLLSSLGDKNESVRRDALRALKKIGPDAHPAIPALTELLNKTSEFINQDQARAESLRFTIIKTLLKIKPDDKSALAALVQALHNPDAKVRQEAAALLGHQGEDAIIAVLPLMIACFCDSSPVKGEAALALWRITQCPFFVSALLEILNDPNGDLKTKVQTVQALAAIGPPAKQAVAVLLEALDTPSDELRYAAIEALGEIGPEARDAVPRLGEILNGKKPKERFWAAGALCQIGKPAQDTLRKSLYSEDGEVRWDVCLALMNGDFDAKPLIPCLIELLYSDARFVRQYVIEGLESIGPDAKLAIGPLVGILTANEPAMWSEIIAALRAIGPDPVSSKSLANALRDKDPFVRQEAAEALGEFGPAAKSEIKALRIALKDPEARVRLASACAVWNVERDKTAVLPVLNELIAQKNTNTWVEAAAIAWEIARDEMILKQLVIALEDHNEQVRSSAAYALRHIGSNAKSIVPQLIELIQAKKTQASMLAAKSLIAIDAQAVKKVGLKVPSPKKETKPSDSLTPRLKHISPYIWYDHYES